MGAKGLKYMEINDDDKWNLVVDIARGSSSCPLFPGQIRL